jgi:hypothetical protein
MLDARGGVALDLGRNDWADWSRSGELLFAREGRLYPLVVASPAATVWNGRLPRGEVLTW